MKKTILYLGSCLFGVAFCFADCPIVVEYEDAMKEFHSSNLSGGNAEFNERWALRIEKTIANDKDLDHECREWMLRVVVGMHVGAGDLAAAIFAQRRWMLEMGLQDSVEEMVRLAELYKEAVDSGNEGIDRNVAFDLFADVYDKKKSLSRLKRISISQNFVLLLLSEKRFSLGEDVVKELYFYLKNDDTFSYAESRNQAYLRWCVVQLLRSSELRGFRTEEALGVFNWIVENVEASGFRDHILFEFAQGFSAGDNEMLINFLLPKLDLLSEYSVQGLEVRAYLINLLLASGDLPSAQMIAWQIQDIIEEAGGSMDKNERERLGEMVQSVEDFIRKQTNN